VKITVRREDGMAVLSVSDTGFGIPAEDLQRVFERFYRADKSRSSGNAGLGLAISRAIVAAHGGSMDVASEENVGTTFTVRLPV
jgi:signal transduction histidine kinase